LFFDATKSHENKRILNNKILDYATEKQNMKNNIEICGMTRARVLEFNLKLKLYFLHFYWNFYMKTIDMYLTKNNNFLDFFFSISQI
jgi:hypothetical protein